MSVPDTDVWSAAPLGDSPVVADAPHDGAEVSVAEQAVEVRKVRRAARRVVDAPVIGSPVEWSAIVEDLQSDLADVPVIEATTEIIEPVEHDVADAAPLDDEISVVAVPAEAGVASPCSALLTISLGPAFPGNVHVYAITIDLGDGTFTGVADPSSKVAGETISGAFGVGYMTIEFRGVYPVDVYANYLWFGSGPLDGFTGGDSLGNVLDTLSATVTALADDQNDSTVGADLADDGEWIAVDELPVVMTVVELPQDQVDDEPASAAEVAAALVAEAMLDALDVPVRASSAVVPVAEVVEPDVDELSDDDAWSEVTAVEAADQDAGEMAAAPPLVEIAVVADEMPEGVVTETQVDREVEVPVVVDEPPDAVVPESEVVAEVEVPVVADATHDVAPTEPEVVPEQPPEVLHRFVQQPVEARSEPARVHGAGCTCLSCKWSDHNPVPVTEGPFAGMAFYFATTKLPLPEVAASEPSVIKAADEHDVNEHSQTRGKRRSLSHRQRQ